MKLAASLVLPDPLMHRGGEPEEMVGMVLFLSSDAASFATGQTFLVDGGQTIRGLVPAQSTIPSALGRKDAATAARLTSELQR